MTDILENKSSALITAFKVMLKEKEYRSQDELVFELSLRGFDNISQSKVSRMLTKVGAIKARNTQNKIVYKLPNELVMPRINCAIFTLALSVQNNGTQIILKTGAGGAPLVARVLDSLESSFGILGTIAGDDTVLIIPSYINKINDVTHNISVLLRITTH